MCPKFVKKRDTRQSYTIVLTRYITVDRSQSRRFVDFFPDQFSFFFFFSSTVLHPDWLKSIVNLHVSCTKCVQLTKCTKIYHQDRIFVFVL